MITSSRRFAAILAGAAMIFGGVQWAVPASAAALATANIRLLPAEKDTTTDAADVSAWYQPDAQSPAYMKYVKAGATVSLEYIVTDGSGTAIANTPVILNVNNKGGGETAIWTKTDGTALTTASDSGYMQQLSGTTNGVGHVTFTVKNNNSDAQSETTRPVVNVWSDSTNGKELKGGFYPTVGATTEHVDRFWPHIVTSGTGGGTGNAPGGGGGGGGDAPSQSCAAFGDATTICPPISQLAMKVTSAAAATPVVNGQASLAVTATNLTFTFTSQAGNSGKGLAVQFFDISNGLTVALSIGDPTTSHACRAGEAAGNMCFINVDAAGAASFTVAITGASVGRLFKYQINGPAGFTSGFVTAIYAANPGGGETADLCADKSRVCSNVSRVTFDVAGTKVPVTFDDSGAGSAFMPVATTSLVFHYTSIADYAGKFAHIQFFDFTTGLNVVVPAGSANSSTSCDPGPAPGHGCYVQLDAAGSATFTVNITGSALDRIFRYQVSGAGGYSSRSVTVTAHDVALANCATSKILAQSPAASGTSGTTMNVTFTVVDSASRPCQGKAVTFTATGWGTLGTSSGTSDAQGHVTASISSDTSTADKTMSVKAATVNYKGATVTATAAAKWLKIPIPPTAVVTSARGVIKIAISNAIGMSATMAYTGAATGSKVASVTAKSVSYSFTVVKGSYTVTVTIGAYSVTKIVSVS